MKLALEIGKILLENVADVDYYFYDLFVESIVLEIVL